MIDRLLEKHLKPIARDYWRWQLWRGLARCWAAMAMLGFGLVLLHRFTGWWAGWVFPLFNLGAAGWALAVWRAWRKSEPEYRQIARQIEQENPKLHALLLTAVEQQPDPETGGLHYLQQRVISEALEHNRPRPWGNRIFDRLFFTQCAPGLALCLFLAPLVGLRVAPPASKQTRDFKVTVYDYPKLERADAKLAYPEYTGLPEKTIADTRRLSAVEGSVLAYTFFLNKPVAGAKLVAKDKTTVPLAADTNRPAVYQIQFTLDQSWQYELQLVDEAGRTNKVPPQFVIEALKNRAPELKLALPRGDQRVSALEEIAFQAEAVDDFGLKAFGVGYTLAGQETKFVQLGTNSGPNEKRQFNYLLSLEALAARTDPLLTCYLWADDVGPDGKLRRTSSDMFFAEVRPFDEIFREGESMEGGGGAQQGGGEAQKLAELQKQIISATWNLQRRKTALTAPPQAYE